MKEILQFYDFIQEEGRNNGDGLIAFKTHIDYPE